MPSMQVGGVCADFASAAGQSCYADIEGNTRESEQVLAKNQDWTRKLIFVDYMPHEQIKGAGPNPLAYAGMTAGWCYIITYDPLMSLKNH